MRNFPGRLLLWQFLILGEVIITETPYASILLTDYYSSHCQFCYRRAIAPIPCCCCARVTPHTDFLSLFDRPASNQNLKFCPIWSVKIDFLYYFLGSILFRWMQSRSLESISQSWVFSAWLNNWAKVNKMKEDMNV